MRPLSTIKRETARSFDISVTEITARSTTHRVARPRIAAYLLSRELTNNSYPPIGEFWARDHTTILSGVQSAQTYCGDYPAYANKVERARRACVKEIQQFIRHNDRSAAE